MLELSGTRAHPSNHAASSSFPSPTSGRLVWAEEGGEEGSDALGEDMEDFVDVVEGLLCTAPRMMLLMTRNVGVMIVGSVFCSNKGQDR